MGRRLVRNKGRWHGWEGREDREVDPEHNICMYGIVKEQNLVFKTFILWEFYAVYFDHIHPSSIPPRSIFLSPSIQLCVLLNFPAHQVPLCCSYVHGFVACHWNMVNLLGTLKKLWEFYINTVFTAFPHLPSLTLVPAASLPQILDLYFTAHINHTPIPAPHTP